MRTSHLAVVALLVIAPLVSSCTDDGNSDAFCDRVADVELPADVLGGLDPGDPGGSRRRIDAAVSQFKALEADAPGAIRADVARLREGVELVLDAVKENPDDPSAVREAIASQTDELAGLAQAGQAVVDYADGECGVVLDDLGGRGAGSVPATSGPNHTIIPSTSETGSGETDTTESGG